MWGHLTRCCQFDDGTRQLAEITYKDALEKYGCLDMEDLQCEAEFLTWDQASQDRLCRNEVVPMCLVVC